MIRTSDAALRRDPSPNPIVAVHEAHRIRVLSGQEIPPYDLKQILHPLSPFGELYFTSEPTLPPGVNAVIQQVEGVTLIHHKHEISAAAHRFLVVHAAGHLLLDHVPYTCLAEPVERHEVKSEHCANIFAMEVLCPVHRLLDELDDTYDDLPRVGPAMVRSTGEDVFRLFRDEMLRCSALFVVEVAIIERQLARLQALDDAGYVGRSRR